MVWNASWDAVIPRFAESSIMQPIYNCQNLPIVYALTVVEALPEGRKVVRGLYIGDHHDVFERSGQAGCQSQLLPFARIAGYRRRHDGGSQVFEDLAGEQSNLSNSHGHCRRRDARYHRAVGVQTFGEDPDVDRLIRKYAIGLRRKFSASSRRIPSFSKISRRLLT